MITTVSLNPAIDKTILIPQMLRGEVNRIFDAREDIGGKGINVAKVLNRLSIQTQVCGFVGGKNRPRIEEQLEKEKLKHSFVEIEGFTRTNTKIVELDKGITTDLNEQGFLVNEDQINSIKIILNLMSQESDFVVFSGSIPQGVPNTIYNNLICEMKVNTKTVLDADGELLLEGIKAGPYMMKPNLQELETAFEVTLKNNKEISEFCQKLINDYHINIIIVSMGGEGSLMITRNGCYKAEPISVKVKSTVGAGDSMIAGMLYGIEKNLSFDKAFEYATACGTLAVTKEGTQTFSLEEVEKMLKNVVVNKIY